MPAALEVDVNKSSATINLFKPWMACGIELEGHFLFFYVYFTFPIVLFSRLRDVSCNPDVMEIQGLCLINLIQNVNKTWTLPLIPVIPFISNCSCLTVQKKKRGRGLLAVLCLHKYLLHSFPPSCGLFPIPVALQWPFSQNCHKKETKTKLRNGYNEVAVCGKTQIAVSVSVLGMHAIERANWENGCFSAVRELWGEVRVCT